jgi:hypothetical protein
MGLSSGQSVAIKLPTQPRKEKVRASIFFRKQKENMFLAMTYQTPQWLANEIENVVTKYNLIHGSLLQLTNYVIHLEKKCVALENEKNQKSSKLNKKCNFSDKGFCKKRQDCPYQHPQLICQKSSKRMNGITPKHVHSDITKNGSLDINVLDNGLTANTFTVMMKKAKRLKPMMIMMKI